MSPYNCVCEAPGTAGYHSEFVCVSNNDGLRVIAKDRTVYLSHKVVYFAEEEYNKFLFWLEKVKDKVDNKVSDQMLAELEAWMELRK